MTLFLLKGLLIGFSIAAPVGPVGLLCIHRTLARGCLAGLVTGLGAASADMLYGCIAGFGLVSLSSLLLEWQDTLRLVGGIFLCCWGLRLSLSKRCELPADRVGTGLPEAYASTFVLTLTNPMTILAFAGILSGLGVVGEDLMGAVTVILGIFLGSLLWWLCLVWSIGSLRWRLTAAIRLRLNCISGILLGGLGLMAVVAGT
jgi:threonine/homoserine/homoserine lactone efflux protein